MVEKVAPVESCRIRSLALDRLCLGLIVWFNLGPLPCFCSCFRAHISFFVISYSSFAIIYVSASSSCLALAIPMSEVSCVRYTLRARDLRSLQQILNGPLDFRFLQRLRLLQSSQGTMITIIHSLFNIAMIDAINP